VSYDEYAYNQTQSAYFYNQTVLNDGNVYNSSYDSFNTTANIDALGYLNKSGTNANQDINVSPYNLVAGNLTLSEKITFSLGEIIDNVVDGWMAITGSLSVSGDLNVTGNVTTTDTFCFTSDCSAKMYHNGSGIVISS